MTDCSAVMCMLTMSSSLCCRSDRAVHFEMLRVWQLVTVKPLYLGAFKSNVFMCKFIFGCWMTGQSQVFSVNTA